MRGTGIVKCPDCKAILIEEELLSHGCKTHGLQWFFDGDYFFANDGNGWIKIRWNYDKSISFNTPKEYIGNQQSKKLSPEVKRSDESPEDEPIP